MTLITDAAPSSEGTPSTGAESVVTTPATAEAPTTPEAPTQQVDQAKTEGDTPADEKEAKADDKPAEEKQEAPAKYEIAAPEGVQLDAEVLTEFKGIAKELGLSQENAQKLADIGPKLTQKWQAALSEQIQQTQTEWAESTRTDKEIGGDKMAENLAVAKRGLEAYGSPALNALLRESGIGNHPEVIRAFIKIGKTVSNDSVVKGGISASSSKSAADILYPTK